MLRSFAKAAGRSIRRLRTGFTVAALLWKAGTSRTNLGHLTLSMDKWTQKLMTFFDTIEKTDLQTLKDLGEEMAAAEDQTIFYPDNTLPFLTFVNTACMKIAERFRQNGNHESALNADRLAGAARSVVQTFFQIPATMQDDIEEFALHKMYTPKELLTSMMTRIAELEIDAVRKELDRLLGEVKPS